MPEYVDQRDAAVVRNAELARFPVVRWLLWVFVAWTTLHVLNLSLSLVTDGTSPRAALLFWTFAKAVAWLLPTAWLVWKHAGKRSLRWLGLCSTRGLGIACLWSCAWLALEVVGLRLQLPLFNRSPPELEPHRLLNALLISPLFEELMFRGALLRALRERAVRRELAVLVSALAFAALHVPGWIVHRGADPGIIGSFVSITGFGVVLGYLGWRTPSLWAPTVLHVANNLLSTGALDWLVNRGLVSWS